MDHHVLDMFDAAGQLFDPPRGALQPISGADVVHDVAVDVRHQRVVVEVLGQELSMH
ncbi:MAG: hypothetical protein IH998_08985, partial [Proteobacteria bacterium]|nr:hypothetical protein [Pseudomonadota bacterium]